MTDTPIRDTIAANQIDPGQMRFIDNYVPNLASGRYRVDVTQTLQASQADAPGVVDVAQTISQEFAVSGPRFAIPAREVHHQFPPANAQGQFSTALPQIVMTHRALPWERAIWDGAPQVPWMALIVLEQNEIVTPSVGSAAGQAVTGTSTGVSTITLSDLLTPQAGVLLPDIAFDPVDDQSAKIQVVDLSVEGFQIAVPSQDVLAMLASVREVNLGDKTAGGALDMSAIPGDVDLPDFARWFSVLSANRFPNAPADASAATTQVVHLVSLEGFTDYLQSEHPAALPEGTACIRMVSLANWSFAALPQTGQSFADLMIGLEPAAGETLSLVMPQTAPPSDVDASTASYASAALGAGYVPRSFHTAQGEQTFAWYRGPFVADLPAPLPALAATPVSSAELAIYDDARGLFDMSYATAFETGRLLALASGAYSTALMRWQQRGLRLVSLIAERAAQGGQNLAQLNASDIADLARPPLAAQRVCEDLSAADLGKLNGLFYHPHGRARHHDTTGVEAVTLDRAMISDALASEAVQAWLADWASETVQPILGFLAKLWLFEGVPYNALVPDNALLPPESFRAFYVDRNWQMALLQGALAVGVVGSREAAFQQCMRAAILSHVETAALNRRNALLGQAGIEGDASLQMSGFLMRSAAVSGWPGLEVKAFHGTDDTSAQDPQRTGRLPTRRLTRLAPNVMLGLFGGLCDWIEVDEPREGLHFGVESNNQVFLRNLSGPDTGVEISPDASVTAQIDSNRVLDLAQLASDLQTALSSDPLGPADLALEMIAVPESMVFRAASGGE